MTTVHDLKQGSPEWDLFRLEHDGASEAAAMLGLSRKTTRGELLRMKATGVPKAFSDWLQVNVLDAGHRIEAAARPHVEAYLGEELFPITCSDGRLSASCDGATMSGKLVWEHKQWNEALAQCVAAGIVPDEHLPQCYQVLMVTKAEKLVFTVSDGTPEKMVHAEVFPDASWFERIRAGWKQFREELVSYTPPEVLPSVVPKAVTALPAVTVQVNGTLVVTDNFAVFQQALEDFIEHRLIREPESDQDFADLDLQIKALKGAEAALDSAEQQMLAQISTIDGAKRTKDMLHKLTRDNRLMAERLLEAKKQQVRVDQVQRGQKAFAEHIAALNARLGKPYMPTVPVDFQGAIKGRRTVDGLKEAIDGELTRARIEANLIADRIQINLNLLREKAAKHTFLFADTPAIVQKAPDDLAALVENRITAHERAEAERLDAQREAIRKEEQAKAEKEARENLAAEQAAEAARAATEQAQRTAAVATAPAAPEMEIPISAPAVVQLRPAAPDPVRRPTSTPPSLTLGAINKRLAPISLTAEGLSALGFTPAATNGAAKLFHEHQFAHICAALVRHIESVQAKQAA